MVVNRLGTPDELLIRPAGSGAVSTLAWSADGAILAIGSEDGMAALVAFPKQMFK